MNSGIKLRAIDPLIQDNFIIFNTEGNCLFIYKLNNPCFNNRQIPEEFLDKTINKIHSGWIESILIIHIDT